MSEPRKISIHIATLENIMNYLTIYVPFLLASREKIQKGVETSITEYIIRNRLRELEIFECTLGYFWGLLIALGVDDH